MTKQENPNIDQTGKEFLEEVNFAFSFGEMGHVITGFPHEMLLPLVGHDSQATAETQTPNQKPLLDKAKEIFHR